MTYRLPKFLHWIFTRWIVVSGLLISVLFALYLYFRAAENTLVFELAPHDNHLVVPVVVAGQQRLFEIDSGCATNVFHTSLRDVLGLREPFYIEGRAADGERFELENFL